jgi:hypothetical protein
MNNHSTGVTELNAVLDQMIRDWMCIINLDAEFCFSYDDDDPNPYTSTITGFQADVFQSHDFGNCVIWGEGSLTVINLSDHGGKAGLISTSIRIEFPEPLKTIFQKHASKEIFDHSCDCVGCDCEIDLPDVERFSLMMYLHGAVRDIRLGAFSETVFRTNAAALATELQIYAPWFRSGASIADQFEDEGKHDLLIKHLRAICTYLDYGGELNCRKLTSLCDVAGSLQPVVSLIQKKMPELVV